MRIEVREGGYAWPRNPPVLTGVNFAFDGTGVMSILGPNGAGKTTLLKCMLGLLPLTQGVSLADGKPVADWNPRELWSRIGYVPQAKSGGFAPMTLADLVSLGRSPRIGPFALPGKDDWAKVDAALEAVGIAHLRHRRTNEVSGGQLQLAMFARALAVEPDLLILDEPESNLDFRNQMIVMDLIERLVEKGYGCLLNTHFPAHALELSRQTLLVPRGAAPIFGATKDVMTEEALSAVFGVRVRIRPVETPERTLLTVTATERID